MKFLNYEFNNKLLDNVILLRVILYIYIFIYIVGGRGSKVVNGGIRVSPKRGLILLVRDLGWCQESKMKETWCNPRGDEGN